MSPAHVLNVASAAPVVLVGWLCEPFEGLHQATCFTAGCGHVSDVGSLVECERWREDHLQGHLEAAGAPRWLF